MIDRRALREGLLASYSLDELRTVCFDLAIDYEDLPGEARPAKAVALIEYVWRRGRLADLLDYCRRDRPAYSWPALPPTELPADPAAAEVRRAWQVEFGIRALRAAVVWVTANADGFIRSAQCGFLVDPRGYILTVLPSTDVLNLALQVSWNHLSFPARFITRDNPSGVTLLRIDPGPTPLFNPKLAGDSAPSDEAGALFPAVSLAATTAGETDNVYLLGYNPESGWINSPGRVMAREVASEGADIPVSLVEVESRPGFTGAPYMNWLGHVVGLHWGKRPDGRRMMIPVRYGLELLARSL